MDPTQIEALLSAEGSAQTLALVSSGDETEQEEEQHQLQLQNKRTELLGNVLKSCQEARASDSAALNSMAEKLGNGSRDVAWRVPLGKSGILDFFIDVLSTNAVQKGLAVHALRIVGNSCADTDENRAKLVDGERLGVVLRQIEDDDLVIFAVSVTYNILVDYEPAQQLASKLQLGKKIVTLLGSPSSEKVERVVSFLCQILGLLVAHESEDTLSDPEIPVLLLNLLETPPSPDDPKDFIQNATILCAYLANDNVQRALTMEKIYQKQLKKLLEVYYHTVATLDPTVLADEDEEDLAITLKQLRNSLLTVVADITAQDSFAKIFFARRKNMFWATFKHWLETKNAQLQTASFLAMGNISRSDKAALDLVADNYIIAEIAKVVVDPDCKDVQLMYSALSFAKNLAIPPQNKPLLGEFLLVPEAVPRLLSLETWPQVQFAAVSLTRLLLLNCAENARQICAPLEHISVSDRVEEEKEEDETTVDKLVSAFRKSDAEPTKLEAARSILSICRMLHSEQASAVLTEQAQSTTAEVASMRNKFYEEHSFRKLLAFLITQPKWPTLRSEAWFVFALMCRSPDGASQILQVLEEPGVVDVLTQTITGRKKSDEIQTDAESSEAILAPDALGLEPQRVDQSQPAGLEGKDRENALVMCVEIKKAECQEVSQDMQSTLKDLIGEGTALVVADKDPST